MRARLHSPLSLLLFLFVLVGCGGGGGGGAAPSQAVLTVVTDWTNHAKTNGGLSERLQLLDSNGLTIGISVVTQSAGNLQTTALPSLPVGQYHFLAQLYSGQNLQGTQVGQIDQWVNLAQNTTESIGVGNAPSRVVVTPTTATVQVQQSQQFYANVVDANQRLVYAPTGTFTWSVNGGVATIGTTGIAIGTNTGSGSVAVKYSNTAQLGAATLTVTPFQVTTGQWTVMVFMNAANDLDSYAVPNFVQMQHIAQNANVRLVVQFKQAFIPSESQNPSFIGTRRYLVQPDTTSTTVTSKLIQDMGTGVDMGNYQTLNNFITWTEKYYPAQRYCLVVWDHGNGWRSRALSGFLPAGVSYDDDTGNHIDTWQLKQAMSVGAPLDIVAWDASLMQMTEVASELKTVAKYVVGSEESPPGPGYPYDLVFAKFRDNPTAPTATLCNSFVDGMIEYYTTSGTDISQSVVDVSQLTALDTAIDGLAGALIANVGSLQTIVPAVRAQAQAYPPADSVRIYRDLSDVCRLLKGSAGIPSAVSTAATNVQNAVSKAVLYQKHSTDNPNSNGISIDFSDGGSFAPVASQYANLNLAQTTRWENWLKVAP